MAKGTKSKSSWLKGVLPNQNQHQADQNIQEQPVPTEMIDDQYRKEEESESSNFQSNKYINNQDKISQDLIVSLENMLNDRQLILHKNKDLEGQLFTSNETISRLKHDIAKKEQLLLDKQQEISVLESNLTNKQLNYDQLLEDYKDYQFSSNKEFENISNQLEKEITKYKKLSEESTSSQYQSMLKINKLEERIRELEIENQKYVVQCQKILDEKSELIQTINEFTERMSFSFSQKKTTPNIQSE